MEVAAHLRYARLSPQKTRLVANLVRGLTVEKAMKNLDMSVKKNAKVLRKVLGSAISNAENNAGLDIDTLKVSAILVNQGPTLRRMHARAKSRSNRILKPTCHITVKVSDDNGGQN